MVLGCPFLSSGVGGGDVQSLLNPMDLAKGLAKIPAQPST